jgi:hypothetical protein
MITYRAGSIEALLAEYERAIQELCQTLRSLSQAQFTGVLDDVTTDERLRSAQSIVSHVLSSGFLFADYIRRYFGQSMASPPEFVPESIEKAITALELLLEYTRASLANRLDMIDEEIEKAVIKTSWGIYNLEQLLEHAIVFALRHTRLIEELRVRPRRKWS